MDPLTLAPNTADKNSLGPVMKNSKKIKTNVPMKYQRLFLSAR
jgi:hypothetical protein